MVRDGALTAAAALGRCAMHGAVRESRRQLGLVDHELLGVLVDVGLANIGGGSLGPAGRRVRPWRWRLVRELARRGEA